MYNVRIGGSEYNIQSGFDPAAVSGVSPGYLHFGFCLEAACGAGVRAFDFLAGDGRARNYKQDFNTRETTISTFQCVRAAALAWLYRRYDRRLVAPAPSV
jgi:CelD/BcsL family acetyltransferase involved in cellulose biosynthesis